ncbi:hypothetical protein HX853_02530 [Marine Group I thaumarchaeote]|uniref:Uncharacterized protein n=1 Tax=Marine Group I thaumarchaeote TaxID=2511932 RepID=A0A7K4P494_9ARCH|nr:hypothetical protein [Marine Group I thaumarchaeote]NWK13503.1 hypothetical protein [Marine Group I thaumarchaeote]
MLVAVIVFPNEIYQLFPETSSNVKNDFEKIKDDAIQKTGTTIEQGGKLVDNQVKDFTESSTESIFESISKSINDFSESTLQTIGFAGILGDDQTNNESMDQSSSSTTGTYSATESPFSTKASGEQTIQTFETLSLKFTQQSNDNIMLRYEDTSGKTISVTVTLRTTEKELFTGIFYSSMFETFVQDVTQTSYFIDMVIEHEEYGTISSSVFNPVDSPDTIINGVFSKS